MAQQFIMNYCYVSVKKPVTTCKCDKVMIMAFPTYTHTKSVKSFQQKDVYCFSDIVTGGFFCYMRVQTCQSLLVHIQEEVSCPLPTWYKLLSSFHKFFKQAPQRTGYMILSMTLPGNRTCCVYSSCKVNNFSVRHHGQIRIPHKQLSYAIQILSTDFYCGISYFNGYRKDTGSLTFSIIIS